MTPRVLIGPSTRPSLANSKDLAFAKPRNLRSLPQGERGRVLPRPAEIHRRQAKAGIQLAGGTVVGLSPSPLWGGWRQPGGGGHNRSARYSPTRPLRGHPPHKGEGEQRLTTPPAKELIPAPLPRRILPPIRSRGRFAQRTWGDRAAGGGRYRHPWGWGFTDLANGQAARPGPEGPASRDAAGVPFYYWASPASRARPYRVVACSNRKTGCHFS